MEGRCKATADSRHSSLNAHAPGSQGHDSKFSSPGGMPPPDHRPQAASTPAKQTSNTGRENWAELYLGSSSRVLAVGEEEGHFFREPGASTPKCYHTMLDTSGPDAEGPQLSAQLCIVSL